VTRAIVILFVGMVAFIPVTAAAEWAPGKLSDLEKIEKNIKDAWCSSNEVKCKERADECTKDPAKCQKVDGYMWCRLFGGGCDGT